MPVNLLRIRLVLVLSSLGLSVLSLRLNMLLLMLKVPGMFLDSVDDTTSGIVVFLFSC